MNKEKEQFEKIYLELTQEEQQVLKLVLKGKSNKKIADKIYGKEEKITKSLVEQIGFIIITIADKFENIWRYANNNRDKICKLFIKYRRDLVSQQVMDHYGFEPHNQQEFDHILNYNLTPRQKRVIELFLDGKTNLEIVEQIIGGDDPSRISQDIREIAIQFGIESDNQSDSRRDRLIKLFFKYEPTMINAEILNRQGYNPLEFPDRSETANTYFYINRTPIEYQCFQQLKESGSLLRIKAPKQMGKTSLLNKISSEANNKGYYPVFINFKILGPTELADETIFLKKFYAWTVNTLDSPPPLSEWDDNLPIMVSCTQHFKGILKQLYQPLVLIIDNLDRIFDYPQIYQNFLPMLRNWHDLANDNDDDNKTWSKLRLVIAYRTEDYGRLDINQSPFNVGFTINLRDFNYEEVELLRKRHYGLEENVVQPLMEIIGGHPSLIRLAFYYLGKETFTLEEILADATSCTGIYQNHFSQLVASLHEDSSLEDVLEKIVTQQGVKMTGRNNRQIYQLEAMGIVKIEGNLAVISRQIYQTFFTNYFKS